MKFKKLYFLLVIVCNIIVTISVSAQKRYTPPKIEDLPRMPVDTILTSDSDTKIIIYTNNTWSYYRPTMNVYDELPVYAFHWDTTQIFAYKDIPLNELPPVVELSLINSINEFHYPYKGPVRSKYGIRKKRNHNGVDISLRTGEPIYATFDGKVRYSKYNLGGYGNMVIVRHQNGLETWYAHMSKRNIEENEYVKAGQIIGFGGSTGRSTGPHLHFEFRYCDQTFDPEFLVDFASGNLKGETFALERSFFNIHSRASEILLEDEENFEYNDLLDPNLKLLAELGDSTATSLLASKEFLQKQEQAKAREEAKKAVYHTIKKGDILGKISRKYGITIAQICKLNNIKSTTTLALGKKLRIR